MLDAPLMVGGDLFVWSVCILIAFAGALVAVDNLPKKSNKDIKEE
ncbi:hypothetical protein ACFLU5_16990 [Bacteroidota bacterium]